MYEFGLKTGNKYRIFFIEVVFEGGTDRMEIGVQKRGLHWAFLKVCKWLIFNVYFTGAGCSYIYRYSCTLHLPFTCPKMSCTTGTYLWVEKLEGIYLSNAEIKKGILRHF